MIVDLQPKKPRRIRRLRFFGLVVGVSLLLLAFDALRPRLTQVYQQSRERRALKQAQAFLDQRDFNNGLLALQVAVRANPGNAAAWRIAAGALENAGANQAVRLREQVASADPNSVSDQLALAATALRFQELSTAEAALARVAMAHRTEPEYLKLLAALAFAQKRTDLAEATLDRVLTIEPGNLRMRLNRATIRLRHASPSIAEAARADLATLAATPSPHQCDALRELARDAGSRGDFANGVAWAAKLVALPAATFDDALLQLNLLRRQSATSSTEAAEEALALRATHAPADAAAFARWLLVHNRARDACRWIAALPEKTRADVNVRASEAECVAALRDWPALGSVLKAGAWGEVLPEAIDLAISARTLEERHRTELRRRVWQECLELARSSPPTLRVLLRLALHWEWPDDAEATLLAIARSAPHETWAFNALISSAFARKDTAALQTAYSLLRDAQPSNHQALGDWAMVSLLAEPSPLDTRAKTVARELHQAEPSNPFFATTYAFALHQQHRTEDALAVMDRLPAAALHVPGRALYYGLFLARTGQTQRARRYLDLATKASLLPEESKLLAQAGALVAGSR